MKIKNIKKKRKKNDGNREVDEERECDWDRVARWRR